MSEIRGAIFWCSDCGLSDQFHQIDHGDEWSVEHVRCSACHGLNMVESIPEIDSDLEVEDDD